MHRGGIERSPADLLDIAEGPHRDRDAVGGVFHLDARAPDTEWARRRRLALCARSERSSTAAGSEQEGEQEGEQDGPHS
jgi:hypothetical protein